MQSKTQMIINVIDEVLRNAAPSGLTMGEIALQVSTLMGMEVSYDNIYYLLKKLGIQNIYTVDFNIPYRFFYY